MKPLLLSVLLALTVLSAAAAAPFAGDYRSLSNTPDPSNPANRIGIFLRVSPDGAATGTLTRRPIAKVFTLLTRYDIKGRLTYNPVQRAFFLRANIQVFGVAYPGRKPTYPSVGTISARLRGTPATGLYLAGSFSLFKKKAPIVLRR